ncbi:hypothetical protein FA95DRAFT_50913 [Auriscalpium vulgare]|uniref:Uncharacterized protein n=1 Tax=Auriscalpium vulgare TaxID=40419 RepID=A0ACB8S7Z9_9AGAM|nr:hypothetical protein FA95DRAFT_50913 [Auriscalpium vulgare]
MSTRTFVVFQDAPEEQPLKHVPERRDSASLSPAPTPATLAAASVEKENLHPVTGARPDSSADPKKRKNTVLATKLYIPPVPPSTLKKREASDAKLDPKKRKVASAKAKSASKSKGKEPSSSRSTSASVALSKKVKALPKLEEVAEVEAEALDDDKAEQARVDSKCYDLTVSPLADVSEAFEKVLAVSCEPREVASRILSPKSCPAFKATASSKALQPSVGKKAFAFKEDSHAFSTPERKRIYAAFTFTSPSPASKRMAAGYNPSLDVFGDIAFNP